MRLRVYESLSSTSTTLREEAEHGAREGDVILARTQTGGRGRLGRSFHSPSDTGLYFSILLRPTFGLENAGYLTTATAVAVARVLERACGKSVAIKWVNDLYVDGKKICGILTESAVDAEARTFRYAVVGVGINLLPPREGFPEELKDVAGAAFEEMADDASKLLADILASFWALYCRLPDRAFMQEYRDRSNLIGQNVTVTVGEESCVGLVKDIDFEGSLILQAADGTLRAFRSGTVRIAEENYENLP